MSSPKVRSAIMDKLVADFPAMNIKDLSSYVSISDVGSNLTDTMLLVQHVGGSERMINIAGEGNQGWEEDGSVVLHYVIPTGFDFKPHLPTMENIRDSLKGRRLKNDVVIRSVTPFSDQVSNAVRVDGGWHGWSAYVAFYRYQCS